jgi:ribonuclease HII
MDAKYIVGIDEVGRGPIAGPVAVCAFVIKDESFLENPTHKKLPPLRDSKKLTKKQRVTWFNFLKEAKTKGFCDFAVSFVSSDNIDKFGINKCIQKALNESLVKITSQDSSNSSRFTLKGSDATENLKNRASFNIFLDGGLHAPAEYTNQETIIKGDELKPVISMASIMAKVSRDRIMLAYAKEYPEYGFDSHVGYGTKAHYAAIKKHGQTPIHRKTFIH